MAKYDATKFYWLQLKEDFFEDDAISWLEEQQPNGRDYAYFYLKLCLKSLKSNGILIRKVGNILIPYDNKKLAELTKMDFDTVTIAMELLKKIGLVQILESGAIYINQLEDLIGSQSVSAFKKQQQRLLKNDGGGQMSTKCPPKIDIELEKEIEIEKKKDNKINIINNIVEYLNQKTNSNYKSSTKKTQDLIKARLNEGFSEEDFKKVIDLKCDEWSDNEMSAYLRPETLFGNKFEGYLNQKQAFKRKKVESYEEMMEKWLNE